MRLLTVLLQQGRLSMAMLFVLLVAAWSPIAKADPVLNDSNYYEIATATDLKWFASQVNDNGKTGINGVLTADIDLSTLGETYWTPIGDLERTGHYFGGTFDGKNHVVSGLVIRPTSGSALFCAAMNAKIKNIVVSEATLASDTTLTDVSARYNLSVIAAYLTNSTVENCHVQNVVLDPVSNWRKYSITGLGGVVGTVGIDSKVSRCSVSGYLVNNNQVVGGIAGYSYGGQIESCQVLDHKSGYTKIEGANCVGGIVGKLIGRTSATSVIGCTLADGTEVNATAGYEAGNMVGRDSMPDEPLTHAGYYEIYTPGQLKGFASLVNGGNTAINGKLMNDLNMGSAGNFTPIGNSDKIYTGTFDGQGYTIDSLTIASQTYAGLFGYTKSCSISNINLTNPYLSTPGNEYQGLIAGIVRGGGSIKDCSVTNGQLVRAGSSAPSYVGGIAGKADEGSTIEGCTFTGTVKAHENCVGGIVGELNSGAKIKTCYIKGPSTVWGNNKVGGIVGVIIDDATTVTDCYADQSTGTITVHAEAGNKSGLIWGQNDNNVDNNHKQYTEDGLIYELTGNKVKTSENKDAIEVHVTGRSSTADTHHLITDIGSSNDYLTDSIDNLQGVVNLDFLDNNGSLVGTTACSWINMNIKDYAFDSSLKGIYMCYKITGGDDHTVMLRPDDVKPVGEHMLDNASDAKVYVDPEYYDEFAAHDKWSKYKDRLVKTTSMRVADFTEDGVNYAYDCNRDCTGSYITRKSTVKPSVDVRQVHVIGCDDSKISGYGGTLKIYQDIGETHAYLTTRIWNNTFKGNTAIKHVTFEEIMGDASQNYTSFGTELGDSCFADCQNLTQFDLVLSSDDNENHYSAIHPSQIPVGKGVFAGSTSVKIRIPRSVIGEFQADTKYGWSAYKDLFEATDFDVTAYTEDGVKYAYYVSDSTKNALTSKDEAEMEKVVTPWLSKYRNFQATDVLCPSYDGTLYYMKASGVDNSAIDKANGVMKLYSDIGNSKDYKTIELSATAFRNNEHIKQIIFEDCAGSSGNASTDLSLVIPDGAFKGCKNLKEISMYYYVTNGKNHYEAIKPSQIFIGENVFDSVATDFRILVLPDYYYDFVTDANWSQYRDHIVASSYVPIDEKAQTVDGVTYDFATTTLNTIPTSETVRLQSSYFNIITITALVVKQLIPLLSTTVDMATITGYATEGSGFILLPGEAIWRTTSNVSFFRLLVTPGAKLGTVFRYGINSVVEAGEMSLSASYVAAYGAFQTLLYDRLLLAGVTSLMDAGAMTAYTISKSTNNAINYISNRAAKNYADKSISWKLEGGAWLRVEKRTNVPHMYVKSVANNDTIVIYNDPGENISDYLTVAVGNDAFHGKDKIRKISFVDRKGADTESLNSMCMYFPDSCFAGCTSLREINLVMLSNGGINGQRYRSYSALTPDNFVLAGDIFAGLDSTQRSQIKITVGEDVLEDFQTDPYWSKYSSMFVTQKVRDVYNYLGHGCLYGLAKENNTFPRRTEVDGHTIEHTYVYGPDTSSSTGLDKDYHGHAVLTNDYGKYDNFKLDYVKARAFKNCTALKTLDFQDMDALWGDTYCGLGLVLRDSAFVNCTNFTDLNLNYQVYDGDNHCAAITPDQVCLGKGVFDGCDKLRIKFWLDQEDAFRADTAWNKYSSKFVPCFFEAADTKVAKLLYDDWHFRAWGDGENAPNSSNFDAIDATKSSPEKLRNLFRGTDILSFEEFRAFGSCGLKQVYPKMFQNCTQLQMIQLPSQITAVGDSAFQNCQVLNSITLPAAVENIGSGVFAGSSVKSIYCENPVPANINAQKAFAGLPSDYIIYVPDTVVATYKEKWADVASHINGLSSKPGTFKVVNLVKAGTLADSLGLKYDYSTWGTSTLKGNYARYDSLRISGPLNSDDIAVIRFMGGRDVDDNKKTVGRLQYLDLYDANLVSSSSNPYNCATLNEKINWKNRGIHPNDRISDDNSVSRLMFIGLDQLRTLILPKSATKICREALSCMSNLQTLVIGDNVTEIENYAGCECPNLKYLVMLPEKVPSTETYAFSKFMATLSYMSTGGLSFSDADTHVPFILTSNKSVASYSGDIAYNTAADSIGAFYADDLVLDAMKKNHVFSPIDLMNLTDMSNMVSNNGKITSFNELYLAKVKQINKASLSNMTSLESVTLPYGCDSITSDAFVGCSNLHTIWSCNDSVPALGEYAFHDLPTNFVVMVPNNAVTRYRAAWPYYKNHIQGYYPDATVTREVNLTVPGTLADSLGLQVVTDGRYITAINGNMSGINRLRVTGPITSKDIAVLRMLGGCDYEEERTVYTTNLQYLDLYDAQIVPDPDCIYYTTSGINRYVSETNEVPVKMFRKCNHLQTIILPRTVTKIGDEAFYDMYSLHTLVIGDDCNDVDGNDAFGESHKLTTMIFLCDKKPELNHDAFTDPVEGDVYKVENMYVRNAVLNNYTSDKQYTQHANHINSVFADDNVFRVWGCKAIATEDDLAKVDSVHGWFNSFPKLTDLSTLGKTAITDLRAGDLKPLASSLRGISLPNTLTKIDNQVFANNKVLAWADFSDCDSLDVDVSTLGITPWTLVYVPKKVTESTLDNVVYQGGNGLECFHYNLTGDLDYDVPKAFTTQCATFNRTFAKGNAYTIALPFGAKVPDEVKAYQHDVAGAADAVYFNEVDTIEPNKPYALRATASVEKIDFNEQPMNVIATPLRTGQSKGYVHTLTAAFSGVSQDEAVTKKMLVMDTCGVWNLVKADTTGNLAVKPFTAYAQGAYADAPTVDVPSVFTDMVVSAITLDETADNSTVIADNNGKKVNAELKLTLTAGDWNTLCVPFSTAIEGTPLENSQVYAVEDANGNAFTYKTVTSIEAGESYLVKPAEDVANPVFQNVKISNVQPTGNESADGYKFVGTYSAGVVNDQLTYLLSSFNMVKAEAGTALNGLHGYFVAPTADSPAPTVIVGGDQTGLDGVIDDSGKKHVEGIYNMAGQRMIGDFNDLPRGIYIVNGQKVVK